jgi:hypothetical protein
MEAARLMRDEGAGNIPVVDGESLSTRSVPNPSQSMDSRTSTRGLRLMVSKVVEVISK